MSIRQRFLAGLSSQLGHPTGIRGQLVARGLNRGNRSATAAAVAALGLAQGERAMDVGFGGGIGIQLLLERLNGNGHVTGVDISETMILAAQRRFRTEISQGRVTIVEGRAEHLPVRDGSVDALLTVNTLYFVDDLAAAMREFRRVMSPGARAAFGVGDHEAMKEMPFTSHGFRLRPTGEITSIAEANGFEISRHERVGQGPRAFHLLIARPRVIPSASDQPGRLIDEGGRAG